MTKKMIILSRAVQKTKSPVTRAPNRPIETYVCENRGDWSRKSGQRLGVSLVHFAAAIHMVAFPERWAFSSSVGDIKTMHVEFDVGTSVITLKPANGIGRRRDCFTLLQCVIARRGFDVEIVLDVLCVLRWYSLRRGRALRSDPGPMTRGWLRRNR
jgi:hypothetical protein